MAESLLVDTVEKKSWLWSTCRDLTPFSIIVAIAILGVGFLATLSISSRSVERIDNIRLAEFNAESQRAFSNVERAIELEVHEFEFNLNYLESTHPAPEEQFQRFFGRVALTDTGDDSPYILVEPLEIGMFDEILGRESTINPGKELEELSVGVDRSVVITRSTVSAETARALIEAGGTKLAEAMVPSSRRSTFAETPTTPGPGDDEFGRSGFLVGSVLGEDGEVVGYLVKSVSIDGMLAPVSGNAFSKVNASVELEGLDFGSFTVMNDQGIQPRDASYQARNSFAAAGIRWGVTAWNGSEIEPPGSLWTPSFEWFSGASGTLGLALAWLMWSARDRRAIDATKEVLIAQEMACTDRLTGLLNRGGLSDAASDLGSVRATLFFIDLNNFKAVNDTHGHERGDQILVAVAQALRETTRLIDKIARVGGDEFVVVMPGLADRRRAIRLARSIERRIAVMRTGVTASVGVASSKPDEPLDMDDLIKRADEEMYQRKQEYYSFRKSATRHDAIDAQSGLV